MRKHLAAILLASVALTPLAALAQSEPVQPVAPEQAKPGQTAAPAVTGTGAPVQTRPDGGGLGSPMFFIVIMGAFLVLYFWMGRGRRKQDAARKQMLSSLKKGDKITTIGGIIGTVIEVRENEVTIKTDETNNVRMKFARWAIRDVGEPAKGDTEEKKA